MTESGPPFNNYVLTTLATSVGSGKVEKTTVVDKDGALRKALYTDRQVILTTTVEDNGDIFYIKYPVTVANNTSAQRVGDVSGYAILYMNGVALEMKCVIGFASNSDDVSISIKATPFFA